MLTRPDPRFTHSGLRVTFLLTVVTACSGPPCPAGYVLDSSLGYCVSADAGAPDGAIDAAGGDACVRSAERCDGVDNDCDGVVDGPAADADCGSVNASAASCMAGHCVFTCSAGYLDCSAAPGCETHGATDVSNCGACGHACAWGSCNSGICDDAVEVAVGGSHACARRATGAVLCWGANSNGQLGDGTTTDRARPVGTTAALGTATALFAGRSQTAAMVAGTGLRSWGGNQTATLSGLLGDGGSEPRSAVPVDVMVPAGRELVWGAFSGCARTSSGAVLCWGENDVGQLCDGTTTSRSAPHASPSFSSVVQIAAGGQSYCAIEGTGEVDCWGDARYGQMGDGLATHDNCAGFDCARSPRVVAGTVGAQACLGDHHACVRLVDGTVRCWGTHDLGQLGDGLSTHGTTCAAPPVDCARAPVVVDGVSGATAIACGRDHACALLGTGAVVCWGSDAWGQLGDGDASAATCGAIPCARAPVAVAGLTDAVSVAAGGYETCAIRRTGDVVCWGANSSGQLGDGVATHAVCAAGDCARSPVRVVAP